MITQLLFIVPVFASRVFAAADFYARFGYREGFRYAQGYLILRRDCAELCFNQVGPEYDPDSCGHSAYVRFLNAVQLTRDWATLDVPAAGILRYVPPTLRSWGAIEAYAVDPDGNLQTYGTANEAVPELCHS